MLNKIQVRGARQHNLQSIDLEIPRNRLTVMTGLSGSGKSSLAFDTIYAEGQRRYIETLSPYARQFLDQMERPDIDSIDGLSPALSIEQKTTSRSPRSTVGTVTEIYDFLRLLYSSVGTPYCRKCDLPIERQSSEQITEQIMAQKMGHKVNIMAPVVRDRKGFYRKELADYASQGFVLARVDGELKRLDGGPNTIRLKRSQTHTIEVVVDRISVREGVRKRVQNSIATASKLAQGLVIVVEENGSETLYSERLACVKCGASMPEFEPRSFSFNSKYGACDGCKGLGWKWDLDLNKLLPDHRETLWQSEWHGESELQYIATSLWTAVEPFGIDLSKPWNKLTSEQQNLILYGNAFTFKSLFGRNTNVVYGIVDQITRILRSNFISVPRESDTRFLSQMPCKHCSGHRLQPDSLAVRVSSHSINDMVSMPLNSLRAVLMNLELESRKKTIAKRLLSEILKRVEFLDNVGLSYLSLDRSATTLSGGEAQRVRLATQIGTRLKGVLYVLDEPSIGLHSRDQSRLLDTLNDLRDLGNTIIIVEHDRATIERADHVIDLGPGAGRLGGKLVAEGTPQAVASTMGSLTADYLSGRKSVFEPNGHRPANRRKLTVRGARQHNLKDITVPFPLGTLCVVTGVSGSGKSTLINNILYPVLARRIYNSIMLPGEHDKVDGLEHIDKVVRIDQMPVGRTPRSNPATYTGVFTPIRDFFSQLPESRMRGYKPGRFSFNVAGGRCEACTGDGTRRIEMNFMPDVFVTCDTCRGRRYNQETLQVLYKHLSIADLLECTIEQVVPHMEALPSVNRKLQTLLDVGLGYVQLGQSSTTLSGGEAQRMKLARELSKRQTGKTVYILDEPTTGLHFDDVKNLLGVLNRLVDHGNTVIVIEHHMDVIRSADWIIDLGPEGGEAGGNVVAQGRPEQVAKIKKSHTGQELSRLGL